MKIHVECLPDETLVKKLGFSRKMVIHHFGKSRVFHKLKTSKNEVAMVDEDPLTVKTEYEKSLTLKDEAFGIRYFTDKKGNRILILAVKLEDWIILVCKTANVDITRFGLSEKPNELHDIINQRLKSFEKLIDHLIKNNNPSINQLRKWLNIN